MAEFTVECRRCGRTMQLIGPIEINYIDECSMCDEDRVSLPKRGDRVRVTEAMYEDCQARPATITILTHAPGCTYPSGGKRCACRWTEEQLEELARGASTETEREMWETLLREVRK